MKPANSDTSARDRNQHRAVAQREIERQQPGLQDSPTVNV